ncbi:MAG TPA: hypothetical protein VM715_07075, partial [Candidatus Acidoferrum sp.]|nr:hypothetical protein [Candidatus Acidoferrum sp.]
GIAAVPRADNAASFAKCRRENLPNMDFSGQTFLHRHSALKCFGNAGVHLLSPYVPGCAT